MSNKNDALQSYLLFSNSIYIQREYIVLLKVYLFVFFFCFFFFLKIFSFFSSSFPFLSSWLPPGHFSPLFLFSSQGLDTEDVGQRLGAGLETSSLSCALPLKIHNITGALVSMHPFSSHTRVFPFSFTL